MGGGGVVGELADKTRATGHKANQMWTSLLYSWEGHNHEIFISLVF